MDVLPPSDPTNPAARARASRIRRNIEAEKATPEDIAWLENYEKVRAINKGRSASRRESYTLEENAAEGTGTAAEVAAHAAWAREEGRREDNLADRGITALERAFEMQTKLLTFAFGRMQLLEDVHLEILTENRKLHVDYTTAEIELMKAQAESEGKEDDISKMASELLPALLQEWKKRSSQK